MTECDTRDESETLLDELEAAAALLHSLRAGSCVVSMSDDELLATMRAATLVARACDAIQVTLAGEINDRSRAVLGAGRLSARKGCRSASELLQRVTSVSASSAGRLLRVGDAVRASVSCSGAPLPPRFAAVGEALESGGLCLDAASVIVGGLSVPSVRADADAVVAAEEEFVRAALGAGPESPVAATTEELRLQAAVWRSLIDPDGVEPDEERAMRHRSLTLGRATSSGVTLSGVLLPEAAARLQRLFDAYLSPASGPVAFPACDSASSTPTASSVPSAVGPGCDSAADLALDTRSRSQQQHDVLLSVLDLAGRSDETPTIGGASPAVMVSVRQSDLEAGEGVGWVDGIDVPLSQRTVRQFTCTGGVQRIVLADNGRVLQLGTEQRCFDGRQRRAITLRDGGCIIPGCRIPASWCEIHHVIRYAEGGPTHTDDGVLLCWFHHRTIEHSGWEIRMHGGAPQVKAPPWLDQHHRHWAPVTKSRTRLSDLRAQRT